MVDPRARCRKLFELLSKDCRSHRACILCFPQEYCRVQRQLKSVEDFAEFVLGTCYDISDPSLDSLVVKHYLVCEMHIHAISQLVHIQIHLKIPEQLLIEFHRLHSRLFHPEIELPNWNWILGHVNRCQQGSEPRVGILQRHFCHLPSPCCPHGRQIVEHASLQCLDNEAQRPLEGPASHRSALKLPTLQISHDVVAQGGHFGLELWCQLVPRHA
mmetsp:Transcript_28785/g.52951  ORF Transcript_28785/g.52951 Transcript_28785/m.52951 type:complete len:215 (+) Transcript_28785:1201-1845(+)